MYAVKLRESFLKVLQQHDAVTVLNSFAELSTEVSAQVIIDGQNVPAAEILAGLPEEWSQPVYYIVDNEQEDSHGIQSFASANSVTLINEQDFIAWVKSEAATTTHPTLTFYGILPQLGVTTLTLLTARNLADQYGLQVGVLGLNLYDPGSWPIKNANQYLDSIRPFLETRELSANQLQSAMEVLPGDVKSTGEVRYLCGNRHAETALEYTLEEMHYLVDVARQSFDIVLIDAGSILNNVAVVEAFMAGPVYAVFTDRVYLQERFRNQLQYILQPLGLKAADITLIGNKMENPGRKTLSVYGKATGAMPLIGIPEVRAAAYYGEQENDPLGRMFREKSVHTAIETVTESIAKSYSFTPVAAH